jgi:hypothetical protein
MKTAPARIGALVLLLAAVGGAAAWALQEEPPAPTEVAEVEDTGMTDAETEELMRAIGYVQQ